MGKPQWTSESGGSRALVKGHTNRNLTRQITLSSHLKTYWVHVGCVWRRLARKKKAVHNSTVIIYSFSSGKTLHQGQPSPRRFFPYSSVVLDYPYGNLADVGQLLQDEEVLFVMYYAPWCASCMRLRQEYEKAAKYLENEVKIKLIFCKQLFLRRENYAWIVHLAWSERASVSMKGKRM